MAAKRVTGSGGLGSCARGWVRTSAALSARQHAAAHAQRLTIPAARDLASQWPGHSANGIRRGAGVVAAAGDSSIGADAASTANGAGPSHAAYSGRPADGSGSSSGNPDNATDSQVPGSGSSSGNRSRQNAADSAGADPGSGIPKDLPKRRDRKGKGKLSKADIYGGQYQLRSNTDWVEPWVTQTIPEDRLPRWEDIRFTMPEPDPEEDRATAAAIERDNAWVRQPHHLTLEQMWAEMQREAREQLKVEPSLAGFVHSYVLMHEQAGLGRALASLLANKLASRTLLAAQLQGLFLQAYEEDAELLEACVDDLHAVRERDPASVAYIQPLLFFKGFQALQAYRLAHWLWGHNRKNLAVALQNRMSEVLHVDIHPGARIGRGVLIDHATGVVVGETAVIGDGVSMLHRVTLGGSGTRDGKRHPTIGNGVLLGAAVSVLGPVTVGAAAKVGAGSVVTMDLPPACVAVGVPARIIKTNHVPPTDMDQCDDYIFDYVI